MRESLMAALEANLVRVSSMSGWWARTCRAPTGVVLNAPQTRRREMFWIRSNLLRRFFRGRLCRNQSTAAQVIIGRMQVL